MSIFQGPSEHPAETLLDVFLRTVSQYPNSIAIETASRKVTYSSMLRYAQKLARRLNKNGVGRGDRVSVRLETGSFELYANILGILFSGAAYVPVDVEDSDERLAQVNQLAGTSAYISTEELAFINKGLKRSGLPEPSDDAWVIFTSGSSGKPKAVAVTHLSAANLVNAEKRLFCQRAPLAPGDRVAATLSPAFDASIEEMWLAWSNGATLVPLSRTELMSGPDLASVLKASRIDALSTVPSIARFLANKDLGELRLLILGGEALSRELASSLVNPKREVWNTYGPTEATIITTAVQVRADEAITLGIPIAGASTAVVTESGKPVSVGEVGELVIAGSGVARYLDETLDRARFRPLPALGWPRAYFTGDYVRATLQGLEFIGRIDEQVKVAGKRIDLYEVENAALSIKGVTASAAIAEKQESGDILIVCYVSLNSDMSIKELQDRLRNKLTAGISPRVAIVDSFPLKTSGKVDKLKLPRIESIAQVAPELSFVAQKFCLALGLSKIDESANFFALGGTSIQVAQLVVSLRERHESVTVSDVYKHQTAAKLESELSSRTSGISQSAFTDHKRRGGAWVRGISAVALQVLYGAALGVIPLWYITTSSVTAGIESSFLLLAFFLLLGPGLLRTIFAAVLIRLVTRGIQPGRYSRNGFVHFRIWLAERVTDMFSIIELAGTPWMVLFARITGSKIGAGSTLDSLPPVLGNLVLGKTSAIGRDVHFSGWTIEGSTLVVDGFEVGDNVRIGNRSFICEGVLIGAGVEIEAGTLVDRDVQPNVTVHGSPMEQARGVPWPEPPTEQPRRWFAAYALAPSLLGLSYMFQLIPFFIFQGLSHWRGDLMSFAVFSILWAPVFGPLASLLTAAFTAVTVRLANKNIKPGFHLTNSRTGFSSWLVERSLQRSRRNSFWLYASTITPLWARLLGARVGKNCEISTFNGQIGLAEIGDECFIADDVSLGAREVKNGWVRLDGISLASRCFIGNSAEVRAGVSVGSHVLVGVASSAPASNSAGESFFGLPPIEFPRVLNQSDEGLTYQPRKALRLKRFGVEIFRLATSVFGLGISGLTLIALAMIPLGAESLGLWFLVAGCSYVLAGCLAATITSLVKWLVVGRVRVSTHDLWTNFVWRNELVWNFVESLTIPWVAATTIDTPIHNTFLRLLGARIGKDVSISTWFLDDPDLIKIGDHVTLMKSSDLQTHLFHDRVMQLDDVSIGTGVTIGAGSFLLPGSAIGDQSTVLSGSLVPRNEKVGQQSTWLGNPIEHA